MTKDRPLSTTAVDQEAFLRHYEYSMFDPLIQEYTNGSDFHNYGYWRPDTVQIEHAQENLIEKLLSALPETKGPVLDVACGKGATTRHLLKYFSPEEVTGIDLGQKQLQTAARNAPECNFLQMDATKLDFPTASFDTIICIEAAFHFDTREKFLKSARRVLRDGGCLLLSDVLMTEEAEKRRKGRTVSNFLAGPDDYRNLLKSCGFTSAEVTDATKQCWEGYFWNAVQFAHRKLLNREIDLDQLQKLLRPMYARAPELEYYLLVVARA